MSGILSLLKSRKFWIAIVGILSVVLNESFGMDEVSVKSLSDAIVVIVGILIAAIAIEDSAEKIRGEK